MSNSYRERTAAAAIFFALTWAVVSYAGEGGYARAEDIPYHDGPGQTDYMRERCRLDVYHPAGVKNFATVVWFHPGGLRGGRRHVPGELMNQGLAVVAVDYRLYPRAKAPAYIEDAAAAVAWTFRNIEQYGGSTERIFVAGVSAGGYLTSMVGLDKRWLARHAIDADRLAGLISVSGHAITHFTVREERGIEGTRPIIDDLAPLYHVRGDAPPMLLLAGDRELEMLGRYEETAYFWRMLRVAGHPRVELRELKGRDHMGVGIPSLPLLLEFVREVMDARTTAGQGP